MKESEVVNKDIEIPENVFYCGTFSRVMKMYKFLDIHNKPIPEQVRLAKRELGEKYPQYDMNKLVDKYIAEQDPENKEKAFLIKNYLENPELLKIIDEELDKKIVGENEARLTIFLVANMRNVENLGKATDNLMVNASSGTGKDHVTEAIFELLPEAEKEELIRTTPKVLAYTRNRAVQEEKKQDEKRKRRN